MPHKMNPITAERICGVARIVKSFVNAYNNLMESSGASNEYDISHPEKFIKSLTKDQEKALSDIGITISASGKLKLDEDKLMETKPAKIGKLF